MLGTSGPSTEGLLPYVNIPFLSTLYITCPFDASLAFLDHIKPAPGCSLQLYTVVREKDRIILTELVAAQRIIAKFANNYFSHRSATSLHFDFNPNFISIGDMGDFTASIRCATTIPISLFSLFLSTFEPVNITGVKTLRLLAHSMPTLDRLSTDFFTALTALEELFISTSGLIHFVKLLDGIDQHCSFPHLKRLTWGPDLSEFPDSTSLILNFLATRRKLGMPIEVFNLTYWTLGGVPMDTKRLEEIPGLKVIWREKSEGKYKPREYICGSGRPQELDATDNIRKSDKSFWLPFYAFRKT
jgi:hypothetical protein